MILIRHGETEWNRQLRFQGHADVALNDIGLEQARRLAARMEGEHADRLVASDLLRAQQTALPVGKRLALAAVTDPALREQCFGCVEGLSVDEIQARYPGEWAGWLRFDQNYAMPDGESTREFHARVMAAIHRLAAAHRDETVVVVTHGGVLDMIYRTARALGLDGPRQSDIPNAGLNRIRVRDGQVDILAWADVAHLAGMPDQPVYEQKKFAATDSRPGET